MEPTSRNRRAVSVIRLAALLLLFWAVFVSTRRLLTGIPFELRHRHVGRIVVDESTQPGSSLLQSAPERRAEPADAAAGVAEPSDSDLFNRYLAKGCLLHGTLSDANAPQSKWTKYDDLVQYGWSREERDIQAYNIPEDVKKPLISKPSEVQGALGAPDWDDDFAEPKLVKYLHMHQGRGQDGKTYNVSWQDHQYGGSPTADFRNSRPRATMSASTIPSLAS